MYLMRLYSSEIASVLYASFLISASIVKSVESKIIKRDNIEDQVNWVSNSILDSGGDETSQYEDKLDESPSPEPNYGEIIQDSIQQHVDIQITANKANDEHSVTNSFFEVDKNTSSNNSTLNIINIGLNISEPVQCKTTACKTAASRLLFYMDHSSDEDSFLEYACGGMIHTTEILEANPKEAVNKIIRGYFSRCNEIRPLEKNLNIFYESCLNFERGPLHRRIERGKEMLDSLGLKYVAEGETFNFTDTVISLILLDSFPVFDVSLEIDHIDTSHLALKLTLSSENYIFETENEKQIECTGVLRDRAENKIDLENGYSDYRHCMGNYSEYVDATLEALLAFNVFGDNQKSSDQMRWIERAIQETLIPIFDMTLERVDSYKTYYHTVKDLQRTYPSVDWKHLYSSLLNKTIDENDRVQVYFEDDLNYIYEYFSNEKELWKLNNALLAHLTYNIYKNFVKPTKPCKNREIFCIELASRLIPDVTSNLLANNIDNTILNDQKEEVTRLHTSIRRTFLEEVDEASNEWLDEKSTAAIKKKINSFIISTPELLKFNDIFNFEKEIMESNYLRNSMKLVKRKQHLKFSLHNMSSSSSEVIWMLYSSPFSDKSVYIYETNTLAIPEVILLKHNKELPDAMNMAHLGHVIASGFLRAFDRHGMNVDDENKIINFHNDGHHILSHESYKTFEKTVADVESKNEVVQLIEDGKIYEYKAERILHVFPFSRQLLNEKLSDIGATKLALETLKRYGRKDPEILLWGDFSKEQIYFLTLAQTFCTKKTILNTYPDLFEKDSLPSFIRAMNIFNNSEELILSFPSLEMKDDSVIRPFPYLLKYGDGKLEA